MLCRDGHFRVPSTLGALSVDRRVVQQEEWVRIFFPFQASLLVFKWSTWGPKSWPVLCLLACLLARSLARLLRRVLKTLARLTMCVCMDGFFLLAFFWPAFQENNFFPPCLASPCSLHTLSVRRFYFVHTHLLGEFPLTLSYFFDLRLHLEKHQEESIWTEKSSPQFLHEGCWGGRKEEKRRSLLASSCS